MGTRGYMGIRLDGRDFGQYVQFDSYPSGWAESDVVPFLRSLDVHTHADYVEKARNLTLVTGKTKPTKAERERYWKYTDNRGTDGTEWYFVLRDLQGLLKETLDAGILLNDYAKHPLGVSYGYVANFDEAYFEVYERTGPWCETPSRGRLLVNELTLVMRFPLNDIPRDWIQQAFPEDDQ